MAKVEAGLGGHAAQLRVPFVTTALLRELEARGDSLSARLVATIGVELRSRLADLKQLFRQDAGAVANRTVAEGLLAAACGIGNIPGPWSYGVHPTFPEEAAQAAGIEPAPARHEAETALQLRVRAYMREHPEESARYLIGVLESNFELGQQLESRLAGQLRLALNAALAEPAEYKQACAASCMGEDLAFENLVSSPSRPSFVRAVEDGQILTSVDGTAARVSGVRSGKR